MGRMSKGNFAYVSHLACRLWSRSEDLEVGNAPPPVANAPAGAPSTAAKPCARVGTASPSACCVEDRHPIAADWYASLTEPGQAQFYEASD